MGDVEKREMSVSESPENIPAMQILDFASQVLHCIRDNNDTRIFSFSVPEDIGFLHDQSNPLGITYDYGNSIAFIAYCIKGNTIDEIGRSVRERRSYLKTYFCDPKYRNGGSYTNSGEQGSMHERKAQELLLDSQNYRGFYEFDESVWDLMIEIIGDAEKMKEEGKSEDEIKTFLIENIKDNILVPYDDFIKYSNNGNTESETEVCVSYTGEGKPKKTLILRVSNIPSQKKVSD